MEPWVIAILPLIGVVLGAVKHFWLGRTGARELYAETLMFQAYADYLWAVAAAAHPGIDEDFRDSKRNAADAKARIAVYRSVEVIKAHSRSDFPLQMMLIAVSTETAV